MKGYKTLIFAMAIAALGVAERYDWTHLVSEENAPTILFVISTLVAVLRAVTNSPMFKKKPADSGAKN